MTASRRDATNLCVRLEGVLIHPGAELLRQGGNGEKKRCFASVSSLRKSCDNRHRTSASPPHGARTTAGASFVSIRERKAAASARAVASRLLSKSCPLRCRCAIISEADTCGQTPPPDAGDEVSGGRGCYVQAMR